MQKNLAQTYEVYCLSTSVNHTNQILPDLVCVFANLLFNETQSKTINDITTVNFAKLSVLMQLFLLESNKSFCLLSSIKPRNAPQTTLCKSQCSVAKHWAPILHVQNIKGTLNHLWIFFKRCHHLLTPVYFFQVHICIFVW